VSGTSADELFTGYYDHHLAYLYDVRNDAPLYQESLRQWQKHIFPAVRNPYLKDPELFIKNPKMREHIFMKADFFAESLTHSWKESFEEETYTASLLRNRMLNELFHEATPVILHEDDLNAMYYSIENRSPYLDRDLFEYCCQIPSKHLIRNGYSKAILRDAMRGIVPDQVLDNHHKVGFNAPILSFLDARDPQVRQTLLEDSPIFQHIRRKSIEDFIQKSELPNSESKFLFSFISAKMFVEEFGS
jgi:asparagine synthase (glutamine-hydrolysing)